MVFPLKDALASQSPVFLPLSERKLFYSQEKNCSVLADFQTQNCGVLFKLLGLWSILEIFLKYHKFRSAFDILVKYFHIYI